MPAELKAYVPVRLSEASIAALLGSEQDVANRFSELEAENKRLREALEQVIAWEGAIELVAPQLGGAIKAMWNARAALSQEEKP